MSHIFLLDTAGPRKGREIEFCSIPLAMAKYHRRGLRNLQM
jgi:hypothetical protein